MNNFLFGYQWSVVLGLYFYLLFQVIYLVQFGSFNWRFELGDIGLLAVGLFSVLLTQYYARKLPRLRGLVLIPFLLAAWLSTYMALGGGLLGVWGVVGFGLLPFVIIIPLGYKLIRRFVVKAEPIPTTTPGDTV